jgi:hypothetical protein
MARLITLKNSTANAMLDAVAALLDRSSNSHIKFYTALNTLVANTVCNDPTFVTISTAAPAVATLDTDPVVTDAAADNAGTVTYFTMTSEDGTEFLRGTVGTSASNNMVFTSNIIGKDEAVTVTSFTLSMPCTPA